MLQSPIVLACLHMDRQQPQNENEVSDREFRVKIDFLVGETKRRQLKWDTENPNDNLMEHLDEEEGRTFLMRGNEELKGFLSYISNHVDQFPQLSTVLKDGPVEGMRGFDYQVGKIFQLLGRKTEKSPEEIKGIFQEEFNEQLSDTLERVADNLYRFGEIPIDEYKKFDSMAAGRLAIGIGKAFTRLFEIAQGEKPIESFKLLGKKIDLEDEQVVPLLLIFISLSGELHHFTQGGALNKRRKDRD